MHMHLTCTRKIAARPHRTGELPHRCRDVIACALLLSIIFLHKHKRMGQHKNTYTQHRTSELRRLGLPSGINVEWRESAARHAYRSQASVERHLRSQQSLPFPADKFPLIES